MTTIVNVHTAKTNLSRLLDRMLAAQARIGHMVLVTSDPACKALGAKTIW